MFFGVANYEKGTTFTTDFDGNPLTATNPVTGATHNVGVRTSDALDLGIALRYVAPLVSGIASLLSVGMFLTTLSFLFTTPGWEPTLGFPGLSALPGQFLLKDIVLLGAAVFTASEAFAAVPGPETRVE
jgi:reactive chlorine resistance protein C